VVGFLPTSAASGFLKVCHLGQLPSFKPDPAQSQVDFLYSNLMQS